MLSLFKRNNLDDSEQSSKAALFCFTACTHFMMWRKSFSQDQIYFLLHSISITLKDRHPNESAFLITKFMAMLDQDSSVMGFLHFSKQILHLDKKYKQHSLQQIIVFLLLGGDESYERLRYVGYIHEDLNLGGQFRYSRLVNKAYKQYLLQKDIPHSPMFNEAVEIVADGLSQTNYSG